MDDSLPSQIQQFKGLNRMRYEADINLDNILQMIINSKDQKIESFFRTSLNLDLVIIKQNDFRDTIDQFCYWRR